MERADSEADRGRITQVTDLEGATLTLPQALGSLRVAFWLYVVCATLGLAAEPWAMELSGWVSTLFVPMHLLTGMLIEPLVLWLGNLLSQPGAKARWVYALCVAVLALAVGLGASSLSIMGAIGSALISFAVGYGGLRWLSGNAPTLRLDGKMIRSSRPLFPLGGHVAKLSFPALMRRGGDHVCGVPLEDIVAVESSAQLPTHLLALVSMLLGKPHQRVVLVLADGERRVVWCGDLKDEERRWLMQQIRRAAEARRAQLTAEGHDLSEPAKAPPARWRWALAAPPGASRACLFFQYI